MCFYSKPSTLPFDIPARKSDLNGSKRPAKKQDLFERANGLGARLIMDQAYKIVGTTVHDHAQTLNPPSTMSEDTHMETTCNNMDNNNHVDYWQRHQNWPRACFESGGNSMGHLLALRRKSLASSINWSNSTPTQSDQKPRRAKSAQYKDPRYKPRLNAVGSFIYEDDISTS